MNKKAYTKAEIEIKYFNADEVIVASSADIEPPTQGNDDLPIL